MANSGGSGVLFYFLHGGFFFFSDFVIVGRGGKGVRNGYIFLAGKAGGFTVEKNLGDLYPGNISAAGLNERRAYQNPICQICTYITRGLRARPD